jgi:hypothetical protein
MSGITDLELWSHEHHAVPWFAFLTGCNWVTVTPSSLVRYYSFSELDIAFTVWTLSRERFLSFQANPWRLRPLGHGRILPDAFLFIFLLLLQGIV